LRLPDRLGQFAALDEDAQVVEARLQCRHVFHRREHLDGAHERFDGIVLVLEHQAVGKLLHGSANRRIGCFQALFRAHHHNLEGMQQSRLGRDDFRGGCLAVGTSFRSATVLGSSNSLGRRFADQGDNVLLAGHRSFGDDLLHLRHREQQQRLDLDVELEIVRTVDMGDMHHVFGLDGALEQLVVENVDDVRLDATVELRHRTADAQEPLASGFIDVDLDVRHLLGVEHQFAHLQVADAGDLLIGEPMEDADLAVFFHARTEFRRAEVAQMVRDDGVGVSLGHHGVLLDEADGLLVLRFLHSRRTDVGREDEDALREVDDFTVAQGVLAGAEDAEHDLVELAARLLPLVDQDNSHRSLRAEAATSQVVLAELRVGVDLIGQRCDVVLLLTVGVTDEVGAGAGELAQVVLLLVLAAVDVEHSRTVAVQVLAEAVAQLRLAGSGGARGDDDVVGLIADAQLGQGAAEGTASGLTTILLTHDGGIDEAAEAGLSVVHRTGGQLALGDRSRSNCRSRSSRTVDGGSGGSV